MVVGRLCLNPSTSQPQGVARGNEKMCTDYGSVDAWLSFSGDDVELIFRWVTSRFVDCVRLWLRLHERLPSTPKLRERTDVLLAKSASYITCNVIFTDRQVGMVHHVPAVDAEPTR